MKRIYRELDNSTKEKISAASKGKPKASAHKEHISQALKKYWQGIPNKPSGMTMNDYLHGGK